MATGIERAIQRAGGRHIDLAYKIGVTVQTVYSWCNLRGIPSIRHIHKVAELTGVPVQDLLPPPKKPARHGTGAAA